MNTYKILTLDYDSREKVYFEHTSILEIKKVYEILLHRCIHSFPDISHICIMKNDSEIISEFINWRR
jgi:hypothetical protein